MRKGTCGSTHSMISTLLAWPGGCPGQNATPDRRLLPLRPSPHLNVTAVHSSGPQAAPLAHRPGDGCLQLKWSLYLESSPAHCSWGAGPRGAAMSGGPACRAPARLHTAAGETLTCCSPYFQGSQAVGDISRPLQWTLLPLLDPQLGHSLLASFMSSGLRGPSGSSLHSEGAFGNLISYLSLGNKPPKG